MVHFFCFSRLIVGGAPVTSWVYRACIIQGSQQIFAAGLWYWGHKLAVQSATGLDPNKITTPTTVAVVTWSLSVLLLAIGVSLYTGLPDYYCQLPGRIPAFYQSLTRRKLVLVCFLSLRNPDLQWFFVTVVLQNFWLSAPYGRNWSYLWSSDVPVWQIVLLVVTFFVGVWSALLLVLGLLSKKHSWSLPVFAIGLGAPRWCQMLWGVTFIGYSLPWADIGSGVDRVKTGLLLGKSLWLWLGVLDAIQGVGFGMLLLQVFHELLMLLTRRL